MEREGKVIYKKLSYEILGAAFEVYNKLGYGFKERYYEEAMAKEFDRRGVLYKRQLPYKLNYKGEIIGTFRFNFLVENKIIVELKQGSFFSRQSFAQVIQYSKAIKLKLAILINMTKEGVTSKRVLNIHQFLLGISVNLYLICNS